LDDPWHNVARKGAFGGHSMSETESAIQAGRDAVAGASGLPRFILLLSPGVVVAVVNFVKAYHTRSISNAIVAGLLWLVLYPFLVFRYSPRPKSKVLPLPKTDQVPD